MAPYLGEVQGVKPTEEAATLEPCSWQPKLIGSAAASLPEVLPGELKVNVTVEAETTPAGELRMAMSGPEVITLTCTCHAACEADAPSEKHVDRGSR